VKLGFKVYAKEAKEGEREMKKKGKGGNQVDTKNATEKAGFKSILGGK